jgi:hypothetical protein
MEEKGRNRMKGRRILVGLLTVLSLAVLTAAPALATEVGPYDVSFVTARYDYPNPGYSTWYYTVSSTDGSNAISHLVFELGLCCGVVDAGVWTDFTTLESWWGTSKIQVQLDPTTQVYGIKFDDGFNDGETRNYYFTVQGNHAMDPEGITVAIKTGGGSALLMRGASMLASVSGLLTRALSLPANDFTIYEASIYGPSRDCEQTTAVTLNNFSATSLSGSVAPVLLIPGALLGTAVVVAGAMVLTGRLRRQEL